MGQKLSFSVKIRRFIHREIRFGSVKPYLDIAEAIMTWNWNLVRFKIILYWCASHIAPKWYQNEHILFLFQTIEIPLHVRNYCFYLLKILYWLNNIDPVFLVLLREILLNFLNQNIGLSNICFDDRLICRQTSASSSAKLPKIFSARCTNPGLFKIFSIGLTSALLRMSSFLDWIWAGKFSFSSIKFWIWSNNSSKFRFYRNL